MNPFARYLLAAGALVVAAFAVTGCDKAKEEPVPAQATVIMPGTQAPADMPASTSQPTVASGSTLPPLVLPPEGSASLPGPGSIGPAASAPTDNEPPSKAPGSKT